MGHWGAGGVHSGFCIASTLDRCCSQATSCPFCWLLAAQAQQEVGPGALLEGHQTENRNLANASSNLAVELITVAQERQAPTHMATVELAVDPQCDLGESPVWDDRTATLYFVVRSAGRAPDFTQPAHMAAHMSQPVAGPARCPAQLPG